jgi:acylphosphatase
MSSPADPHSSSREPPPRWVVRRCLVSGRVQGVYYRGSARERARAAGITGHAVNLPDGRVEVLAWGQERAVADFIEWLWVGPGAARVSDVQVEDVAAEAAARPGEFTTG